MQTLVLDQAYRPHRIVPWQEAVCSLFEGRVEVVEVYDYDLHSTSIVIKCPAVVRLIAAVPGRKKGVRFSRINILTRDRFTCCYCGRGPLPPRQLNYDHVVPRSLGGTTTWENIVASCLPCNDRKGGRTPAQAGMRLLRVPARPAFLPITMLRASSVGPIPAAWRPYWTIELEPL